MVDIAITAANVVAGADAVTVSGKAGETITAGQVVYKAASGGKWALADSNSATAEVRTPVGIALNGAALNQPITVQTAGSITIGGTLVAGVAYYLSDTPGGICPIADVGAGEYVSIIGIATTTAILNVGIKSSGVAL